MFRTNKYYFLMLFCVQMSLIQLNSQLKPAIRTKLGAITVNTSV